MEIIIEVGNDEQKDLLKSELLIIDNIFESIGENNVIKEIIVPNNFDEKIRLLTSNKMYESLRTNIKHVAIANTISDKNDIIIVFSPFLFTESYDIQVRVIIYLHEVFHAINKKRLPIIQENDQKKFQILSYVCTLFDEYYAVRKSLEITHTIFEQKSDCYLNFIKEIPKEHLNSMVNPDIYYNKIKNGIIKFKFHQIEFQELINTIYPLIHGISLDLIYVFAYLDTFNDYDWEKEIERCKFYNSKTVALIEYLREKCNNNNFNLNDSINIVENGLTP